MNKNLGWKLVIILAAVLLFVYGVFGIPSGLSGSALGYGLVNPLAMRNGIHLGVDLKGGTHLTLQVQGNDAVNIDNVHAVQTINAGLLNAKGSTADIAKPD